MAVDSSRLYPLPGEEKLGIPAVSVTQFFSNYFGVLAGKLDTTTGDANEFAHGKGDKQFLNLALNFIPGNTTYAAEGRVRTDFFGLTGHQLAGVMYSTKDFTALEQSLRFIITSGTIDRKDGSWCVYYNFDQYIHEPKKGSGRGIGVFGRIGFSDGNPNPLRSFFSVGIGGKGVAAGRPLDGFGLGFYYIDVSNPRFTGPLGTREFLRDEYGAEAYYNMAVTPWMKLTPDIQFVRPAQKKKFVGTDILTAATVDVDTATVFGVRLQLIF